MSFDIMTSLAHNPTRVSPKEPRMTARQQFIARPYVADFIEWFARELDSRTLFQHTYIQRRTGKVWACESLYDAFETYQWNSPANDRLGFAATGDAAGNAQALKALRRDLKAAGSDDAKMLQATLDVMAWGGVTAGNAQWLRANERGLAQQVNEVAAAIDACDPAAPVLRAKTLRFNAGMTKVYSLLCADFIIYDSRVAAFLGHAVVLFCTLHGLTTVPQYLCFPWAGAKEGKNAQAPKRRNPGNGTLAFIRLRSHAHHALWNLRASWVMSAVLAHPAAAYSRFNLARSQGDALRALESAAFMYGYCLGAPHTLPADADCGEPDEHVVALINQAEHGQWHEIDVDEMLAELDIMIKKAEEEPAPGANPAGPDRR